MFHAYKDSVTQGHIISRSSRPLTFTGTICLTLQPMRLSLTLPALQCICPKYYQQHLLC